MRARVRGASVHACVYLFRLRVMLLHRDTFQRTYVRTSR